tara:strand:+ start:999 stop:1955 length:957 start_codon:yes stop_codon:yes gene_type:complete
MYTPFKMKGKSPMMKKLIGNQNRLPKELQEAIKAAPGKMKKESATKMKKASMTKMKKESMAKLKKSVAKLKKGKINPFSAEYKRMTESQRKRKYGADYKDRIKGKTKSDGKTKLKPINRKNISEALNKTKNRINELNKNIQAGADKLSKDLKSKKTIKITGNNNSSSSSSSSNGFTSRKGDPYLYKKNNDGTFTTKKGKDGKEVIVKKGSKAYDAISSVFKMKKAPAKMKKAAMKMKKEAAMKMKKKSAMKMKKSMAKEKMKMVTVNGKKVPAFAADGKGANDMKKGSAATMKKKSMAKMKKAAMKMKKAPAKMMKKK